MPACGRTMRRGNSTFWRGGHPGGLGAAAAVGDDRLQRMSGRAVQPESFTHGTSAQREEWFGKGLRSGSVEACNTFG